MGKKNGLSRSNRAFEWLRKRSIKMKIFLGAVFMVCSLVGLKLTVRNHAYFFIASEAIHAAGIIVLVYKLTTQKSCSGLSSKTQELTAMFLAARLVCSTIMEADIHTVLDFTTFVATAWVIYMIRFKLKYTYVKELDSLSIFYVMVPAIVLATFVHPYTMHNRIVRILWAVGVYIETLSVLPQLRMIQNAKMIEPFTAHYVFALGVARFLSFAHWIIRVYETRGLYLFLFGNGYFWFLSAFISEIIQTFILADFCYYYVKSFVRGQLVMRMPI